MIEFVKCNCETHGDNLLHSYDTDELMKPVLNAVS